MAHNDSGWRPHLATDMYNGFEVFDHGVGPHELNEGETDGVVRFGGEVR